MDFHIHGFTNGMTHNSVSYCGRLRLIIYHYSTFICSMRFFKFKNSFKYVLRLFHFYRKAKRTLYLVDWSVSVLRTHNCFSSRIHLVDLSVKIVIQIPGMSGSRLMQAIRVSEFRAPSLLLIYYGSLSLDTDR